MRALKSVLAIAAFLLALFGGAPALAQATFPPPNSNPHAVPTFQSIGLYWHNPGGGTGPAMVEFTEQGSDSWRRGLDLWYDARNSEYRGSLVELRPGTYYDIRITREGSTGVELTGANAPRTWSEDFHVPAGHTMIVPAGTTRIIVQPTSAPAPSTSGTTTLTINAPRRATSTP